MGDPGHISLGNLKTQVVEVHFSCILRVILTLPLRLSGPLWRVTGCRRTYRTPAFSPFPSSPAPPYFSFFVFFFSPPSTEGASAEERGGERRLDTSEIKARVVS